MQNPSPIITEPFSGERVWSSSSALEAQTRFSLSREGIAGKCAKELSGLAESVANRDAPAKDGIPSHSSLDACRELAASVRRVLDQGPGFAIIDDFPLADWSPRAIRSMYWGFMSLIGRPVAQTFTGEMIYDVRDEGIQAELGKGVRSSKTADGQVYHTDNHPRPPSYVSLLCLRTAEEGGLSGLINLYTVYNQLLARHPNRIRRMYQSFWFDRQREHAPEESPVSKNPIFEIGEDGLRIRVVTTLIRQGYELAGEALDHETREALDALDEVMESPGLGKTFAFQPGQIQIINNRRIGHRRTPFRDASEPEKRRHLIRLWLRDEGDPSFLG
ncbi:MAG TPA: hypothetical protein DHW07_04320 [Gammaproteobacteria bacterium]|nr:hypothetical protein [Gammaproteobacteria bacterium]